MKTLVTIMLSLTISYAPAQVVKKKASDTKRKAGQRTEERVDQRVEEGIDKSLNAFEGLFKKKKNHRQNSEATNNQPPQTNPVQALLGGEAPLDLPEAYHFSGQMEVLLTSTNKRGKEEQMPIRYHLQPQGEQMGISMDFSNDNTQSQAFTIFDMKNRTMVVLSESGSQRVAMAIPIKEEILGAYQSEEDTPGEVSFTATGRTRQILGYPCQEYRFSGPDYSGTSWISDALPQYQQNFLALAQQTQRGKKQPLPQGFPQGTMLEMQMDMNNGEKMHWLATRLQEQAPMSISLDKYQLISLPAGAKNN